MNTTAGVAAWSELGRMLDDVQPRGLGILLPAALQLHRPAYCEARARNIVVGVALPSQVGGLTALVEEAPIEAVVATEASAQAFAADLERAGIHTKIKAWCIVGTPSNASQFRAPSGLVMYSQPL